ncbi:hypothetical protein SDRG_00067 [Saprolegnia diclina VS20]|uniref:G-protein coupled receptors family 3 profile domain-containing protein n=1 Tax=Saprolegnia diclina (strain VS20) TaxID=1156394 RepID=T0SAH7_SAPDV|nr:hypothetical protein SDRG_00067 [Saprolegnia diclina VS20]EQC42328.1 hypothetical protein SDRG_00067 [Saprolegnia diclina VS20]|eukprot:XP_008603751.1 hypothetical protein SDRG_00067 [Saprolegnia diclina VS20]
MLVPWLVVILAAVLEANAQPTLPSNFETRRLNKCLDAAWVAATAKRLNLDPNAIDSQRRRANPLLRQGLQEPRFTLNDPRQYSSNAFKPECFKADQSFHGVGERVYPNGSVATTGTWNGSLVLEYNNWQSQTLTTSIIAILASEVVGYPVSFLKTSGGLGVTERMSSVGAGVCTPSHVSPEVWTSSKMTLLNVYANETSSSAIGYNGQSGLYTLQTNVDEALKGPASTIGNFSRSHSADWWRDYVLDSDLINFYSIANFNMSQVGQKSACADGLYGCLNGCSQTAACTAALAQGKTCMLVASQYGTDDQGYLQSAVGNNNIPARFCFAGYAPTGNLVTSTMASGGAIVFYHYEPDMFHFTNPGKFVRISLPRPTPEMVVLATGQFGSNGFGQPSPDPVSVDYPEQVLMKYYSNYLLDATMLNNFLRKFQITKLDINNLLLAYANANASVADIEYAVACDWVQKNYEKWYLWVDRLPLCTMSTNMRYSVANCNSSSQPRVVTFAWTTPDPANSSHPYDCDGGFSTLPPSFYTSRSCEWLDANTALWSLWLTSPPTCDLSFYNYSVSECTSSSIRNVEFFWLLPSATNYLVSGECINGVSLPSNTTVACDYVPTFSGVYTGIATITVIVLVILVVFVALVLKFREKPVIKRSQWHLLLLLLLGGILICAYVLLGGGAPSSFLCGARPFVGSLGYTLCFGSLLVKSLRVYLVFENKAMKKRVVSVWRMLRILSAIVGVDIGIVVVWLLAEFPSPSTYTAAAAEFTGTLVHVECHSSSFIFPVLSIFWKAVVTFVGLYVSFLIRHVSGDFQESIWIFAASCVVLVGSLLMLTMTYLVVLPAAAAYGFLSAITLFCTVVTMALMFGPKFTRLNRDDVTTDATHATSKETKTSMVNVSGLSKSRAVSSANGQ